MKGRTVASSASRFRLAGASAKHRLGGRESLDFGGFERKMSRPTPGGAEPTNHDATKQARKRGFDLALPASDGEIVLRLERVDTRGSKRLARLDLSGRVGPFELRGVSRTGCTVMRVTGDVDCHGVRWTGRTLVTSVSTAGGTPTASVDDWAEDAWYQRYRTGAASATGAVVAFRIPADVEALVLHQDGEVRRGVRTDSGTIAFR